MNWFCCVFVAACLVVCNCVDAQTEEGGHQNITDLPSKFLDRFRRKAEDMDRSLTRQTGKCLAAMSRSEQRMRRRLYKTDSAAARQLFDGASQQYTKLSRQISTDTALRNIPLSGEYRAYTDSLNMM